MTDDSVKTTTREDTSALSATQRSISYEELLAPDEKWKVQVFRCGDGSFGFASLRFSEEPGEILLRIN